MQYLLSLLLVLAPTQHSALVYPGPDGKLVYKPDALGNTIPDFSNCGYMGGGVRIPDVPAAITLEARSGNEDDTARIQSAIDDVSKRAPGAVLLRRGTFRVSGTLRISASGVVLRGEGDGEDGTILLGTGTRQRALIIVSGSGEPRDIGSPVKITDTHVPLGARQLTLANARGLAVGQPILVRRRGNAKWIHEIKMDQIPGRPGNPGSTRQWEPFNINYQRVITRIEANRITIDAPIVQPIEEEYGGGEVVAYEFPGRIENVGVEHLRGVSEFDKSKKDSRGQRFVDEDHAWSLVQVDNAANGWVRNVTARYFGYSCVFLDRQAVHFTVQDCKCLEMVAVVTGGRMYCFNLTGQLNLFLRCHALDARHAFVLGSRVAGPNAYVDCDATSDGESGPHHRWSTGTLFDNVKIDRGGLRVYDRGNMGSGHGWSGAQQVFWNCTAADIRNNHPPTAFNWAIGCSTAKHLGDGWWESPNAPVEPRSLYFKQLEDRLDKSARSIAK